MTRIFLGLGSNQDAHRHLCAALDALRTLLGELRCSPVFESHSVGIRSDNFYNLVVQADCALSLAELRQRLKVIEVRNGRQGGRSTVLPLDIDILLYGDCSGLCDGLELPRAEVLRNAFVLWPLALLAPEARHPLDGRSFAELWAQAQIAQTLWPVPFAWNGLELTPAALCAAFPAPW